MLVERLKEVQKQKNWSQEQLADYLGVSRSLIAVTFSGKRKPSVKLYAACLKHLPVLEGTIINCLRSRVD